jgi:predicted glycoside hydrolase/deacetylase ChbG (UPF0249 family)
MPPTLAERLGFDARDRIALVHADDIGLCHAANQGAFEALERGPATCGSLMVPCPWFREAVEHARAHPELDLGIHLTLNAEFPHYRWGPLAGRSAVPSLLDEQGYLASTSLETAQRAKPEEVETELRTQIEHALAAGIDVTHLDSHMGTVFYPPFVDVYARLAADYRLPVFAVRPDRDVLKARGLEQAAPLFARVCEQLDAAGIPVLDHFDADSLHFEPGRGLEHNRRRLADLRPGLNYLICHPARGGEELTAITPESAHQRDFERSFYGGEAGRQALEELGIRCVGMRALRDLVRGG